MLTNLAAYNNWNLLLLLRWDWLPREERHLGGMEVELLDQVLLVVGDVVGVLLRRKSRQVGFELVHDLLLVIRQRRTSACGG